jgi:hypothetical protein
MDYPSLSPVHSPASTAQIVAINRCDRWQVHHRLQELGIPCACLADGRLQVEVNHPIAAVQIWSVTRHITASRQQLARWLEQCWKLEGSGLDH